MSKEAIKQRKLLVKKLKERGVSVTNPLFEHGMKIDRLCGVPSVRHHKSCTKRAKYQSISRGHKVTTPSTQQTKVIIKLLPVTLSIAELAKASGMFKGTGGTRNTDHSNGVADQFEKTHVKECKKTSSRFSRYYTEVGKGWTKGGQGRKPKKPIDEQPS